MRADMPFPACARHSDGLHLAWAGRGNGGAGAADPGRDRASDLRKSRLDVVKSDFGARAGERQAVGPRVLVAAPQVTSRPGRGFNTRCTAAAHKEPQVKRLTAHLLPEV